MRLELNRVFYTYPGNDIPALAGISCTVGAGDFIVLTGSNGSGKSTLARVLAGLIEPDEGEIHGRRDTLKKWNGVALVMQEPAAQLLTASVEEEIAWGLENLGLPNGEISHRVESALDAFGLKDLRRRPPETLTDGECQIVAFASVYAMEPDILILDEATAFLDLKMRHILLDSARLASSRCGVIWITTHENLGIESKIHWHLDNGKLSII